jgi:hypothetical protein
MSRDRRVNRLFDVVTEGKTYSGVKIKYSDGGNWVTGVLESAEPVVLALDDKTEIRTTSQILQNAISEGLVVKV